MGPKRGIVYQYDLDGTIDIRISDFLWDLMEQTGTTSAVLAKKSRLSKTFIRDVLRGTKRLTLQKAIRIFSHLGCELDLNIVDKKENVV